MGSGPREPPAGKNRKKTPALQCKAGVERIDQIVAGDQMSLVHREAMEGPPPTHREAPPMVVP